MPSWKKREEVPKDIQDKMRWRGHFAHNGRATHFECEEVEPQTGGACLFINMLMDTSQIVQHINLQTEYTLVEEAFVGGQYAWFARRIALEET